MAQRGLFGWRKQIQARVCRLNGVSLADNQLMPRIQPRRRPRKTETKQQPEQREQRPFKNAGPFVSQRPIPAIPITPEPVTNLKANQEPTEQSKQQRDRSHSVSVHQSASPWRRGARETTCRNLFLYLPDRLDLRIRRRACHSLV